MRINNSEFFIGTSGWSYKHWIGPFYPEDINHDDLLKYYSDQFHTVEINGTFYNLPEKETVEKWVKTVPDNFVFSVKAGRFITHMKKLKDPEQSLRKFMNRIPVLGKKLGPILFQLPPNWNYNEDRFRSFVEYLPPKLSYAFEFRDKSWINESSFAILKDHNIAFCIYDLNGYTSPNEVTSDTIYVRLHGPGQAYEGSYSPEMLKKWRDFFKEQLKKEKSIYCYFDNDTNGYAPRNAQTLIDLMDNA